MVRGLQLIIHLPLLACSFPSRFMFFIAQANPIVKFDPIAGVLDLRKFINYKNENGSLN